MLAMAGPNWLKLFRKPIGLTFLLEIVEIPRKTQGTFFIKKLWVLVVRSQQNFFFESILCLNTGLFFRSDVLKIIFVVIVMSVFPKFISFVRFQYFRPFLGSSWFFPARTCHNPSNIHFFLLNLIAVA